MEQNFLNPLEKIENFFREKGKKVLVYASMEKDGIGNLHFCINLNGFTKINFGNSLKEEDIEVVDNLLKDIGFEDDKSKDNPLKINLFYEKIYNEGEEFENRVCEEKECVLHLDKQKNPNLDNYLHWFFSGKIN